MIREKEEGTATQDNVRLRQEPRIKKPTIICCIKSSSIQSTLDGYGLPIRQRDLVAGIELEKKIQPTTPVYILKRQVKLRGIVMPVLDVLDTRNTYLWVEVFRQKIVQHKWTEEEAKVFFKYSVSKDILENIVQDLMGQSLRDSVRKIYDRVYTEKNIALLQESIQSLKSSQFVSLEEYREELALLIRSYSVRILITPEGQEALIQKYFWTGLSDSIKSLLEGKISKESTPDEIIRQVFLFKQKMTVHYNLPSNFTGVIHMKKAPKLRFPIDTLDSAKEESKESSVEKINCSWASKKPLIEPIPSIKERVQPVLPSLRRLPKGIIIKNNPMKTLSRIVDIYDVTRKTYIYRVPRAGSPFVVYSGCIENWVAGILIQKKQVISIFKQMLAREETEYTETEKCILAIEKSKKIFQPIVGDSAVVFTSEKYKSFVYTTENGIDFVDCLKIEE